MAGKLKPLDKYRLGIKIRELGKIVWNMMVRFSYLTISLFFLITAFVFWGLIVSTLSNLKVDISQPVSQMFLIVIISVIIVSIEKLRRLNIKNEW